LALLFLCVFLARGCFRSHY